MKKLLLYNNNNNNSNNNNNNNNNNNIVIYNNNNNLFSFFKDKGKCIYTWNMELSSGLPINTPRLSIELFVRLSRYFRLDNFPATYGLISSFSYFIHGLNLPYSPEQCPLHNMLRCSRYLLFLALLLRYIWSCNSATRDAFLVADLTQLKVYSASWQYRQSAHKALIILWT